MQSITPKPVQATMNQELNADNDLRAQLAAVIHTSHPAPQAYGDMPTSGGGSPHESNLIDPAIGGQAAIMNGEDPDDAMDGRKGGKRELSQSKRAAQNRAAQRAFRQRKEGYIKKLEEQVREMNALENNYKAIQAENYSLREYIIHLQSRLIENNSEYPQPPPNINLRLPHSDGHANPQQQQQQQQQQRQLQVDPLMNRQAQQQQQQQQVETAAPLAPMAPMGDLQGRAARTLAVAGLIPARHQPRPVEDTKTELNEGGVNDDDVIRTQLQASNHGLPLA